MSDPRHVSSAHPQAVLQAWGGPSLDIDLGGWLDHDARAFEAALGTTRLLIVPTGHAELLAWQKKALR